MKPLVFYTFSVFLGSLTALISVNNLLLGAAVAASFLILIYATNINEYSIIIFAFFILGIINYLIYFNPRVPADSYVKIRIIEKNNFNTEGIYNGRKLRLSGEIKELSAGDTIYAKGVFIKEPDYEKGIAGTYELLDLTVGKRDFYYKLQEFKRIIYTRFSQQLGDKRAAVLVSAAFGDVAYIQKEQMDELNKLGIVHIVSVSGLHMAVIYKLLETIGGYGFGILISFIYAIFTGAQASTVRAFIMIVVLKLSKKLYKKYDKLSSLSLSAMILLILKPYYISDLGFMLSFLSVLGIILFYEKFKRIFYYLPQYLNDGISLTLSAQSFSTPYALFYFKSLGSGFILGNIFLLPLYSALVILGNFALLFINTDHIFEWINFFVIKVMIAIEGGTYLLLSVCPPTLYFSYAEIIAVLVIYISYMLYRHGRKSFIYLPLGIMLIGLHDNYKIFPEIHYMKIYNTPSIIVKYKGESILFMDKIPLPLKDMAKGKGTYSVDDIQLMSPGDISVKLGSKMKLKIKNYPNINRQRNISIEIITSKGRTVVIFEGTIEDGLNPIDYDIIYLKNKNEDKSYEISREIALLKIFFNKVYVIS